MALVALTKVPLDPVATTHPVRAVLLHFTFLNALSEPYSFTLSDSWWFMSALMVLYLSFLPARPLIARGRWAAVIFYGVVLQTIGLGVLAAFSTLPPEQSGLYEHFVL